MNETYFWIDLYKNALPMNSVQMAENSFFKPQILFSNNLSYKESLLSLEILYLQYY